MHADEARDLLAYDEWANARLVAVIRELPDEAFARPVASSFGSLRDTLAHLIAAQWAWLKRWTGDSPTDWPAWLKESGRSALLEKLAEVEAERAAFASGLTDAQIETPLAYRSLNGQSYENRLGDLVRHVVNHSTYHRGQAATQLRQLGVVPPSTDFMHLLPVDQTLHWANPPGGVMGRDTRPDYTGQPTPGPYGGPVPMVTHVHGAVGVSDDSDGYAEAWFLPKASDIPAGYADRGTWYDFFAAKAGAAYGVAWGQGFATFQYPNNHRAATLWYHDHTLGMTRLNVYAGPAGFYIVRGGPDGDAAVMDLRTGLPAVLPGPAPKEGDKFPSNKTYYEIPIAIQDRAFNDDGSLFYPASREFFDGIVADHIPAGEFPPIWNPEFFGNMMMVNGNTWPFQVVEKRRYRFRLLNGCQSRFLILDFGGIPGVEVWQIGNEGGVLAAPVNITANHRNRLLMGLAERADVIVDFANVAPGSYVLGNLGPDEPFGGGEPGVDFDAADAGSTGQVMQFRVVPALAPDPTTPPQFLQLPAIVPLPPETVTRSLALIEKMGMGYYASGQMVEGPVEALLGVVDAAGMTAEKLWREPITEDPAVGACEVWAIFNTTGDAHPMHLHEAAFEVVNREALVADPVSGEPVMPLELSGVTRPPEPWETGFKDTVIAYPGEVTRIRARFEKAGQYVWHCHIVEHEDNEMMRPYRIGPEQPGQPMPHARGGSSR